MTEPYSREETSFEYNSSYSQYDRSLSSVSSQFNDSCQTSSTSGSSSPYSTPAKLSRPPLSAVKHLDHLQKKYPDPDNKPYIKVPPKFAKEEWYYIFIPIFAVSVIVLVFMMYYGSTGLQNEYTSEDRLAMVKEFNVNMDTIMKKFPNQSPRFWKNIKASMKAVLRNIEPQQPAVILMASRPKHAETVMCLSKHVAKAFSQVYRTEALLDNNIPVFSPRHYADVKSNSDAVKRKLDEHLKTSLSGPSGRVAMVTELQQMSGQAAMMLHAYCDNDNAPHKDAAIVLTVTMDEFHESKGSEVEDVLTDAWSEQLGIDMLTPLLSRIANYVAIVTAKEDHKNLC